METQRVLIVDDRHENLLALEGLLAGPELELVAARSGNEALGLLLEEGEFALVLLDVQMPEMDGFEVAALMRGHARTRHIPIIFVTAVNHDERYVQQGHEAGAVDYLSKPIDPAVLRSKVRVFCDLAHQRRALEQEIEQRQQAQERLQQTSAELERVNASLRAEMAQRQRVEEALREAERVRVLAETAGAAAHEINQPLTALIGIVDLLLVDDRELDEDLRQRLQLLNESAERISEVVRNMGSIRRYETQEYVQGKRIVDLSAASRERGTTPE